MLELDESDHRISSGGILLVEPLQRGAQPIYRSVVPGINALNLLHPSQGIVGRRDQFVNSLI
jgi:hypothetical protein